MLGSSFNAHNVANMYNQESCLYVYNTLEIEVTAKSQVHDFRHTG